MSELHVGFGRFPEAPLHRNVRGLPIAIADVMLDMKALLIGIAAVSAGSVVLWGHVTKPNGVTASTVAAPQHPHEAAAAPKNTDTKPAVAPVVDFTLAAAIQEGRIQAELKGNGKDKLVLTAQNTGAQPIRLHLGAGQLFDSGKSTIALVRSREIEIAPKATVREELSTVAIASANVPGAATYELSTAALPKLGTLFAYLNEHPEISTASVQTAVLALMENPSLSLFAKFAQSTAAVSQTDAKAFKTDTSDIIGALSALRAIGLDAGLAIAADPQLKIEAMIDPLAHALALRYYNVTDEWAYWKRELLDGDGSTRHYALYGIARFYPEVALQMLPTWAREARTNPIYRVSAVQALAETQRPEALSTLRQLEREFGTDTELGKAARTAAAYLDAQFAKAQKPAIGFRTSSKNLPQQTRAALDITGIATAN